MARRGLLALTLLFWATLVSAGAPSQAIGPVELERAFGDIAFDEPVFLTSAGDGSGRLFVVEQRGVVHVLASTAPGTDRGVFLDITGRVSRARREEGLLGLAFDPGFASNGYFYLYYSAAGPRRSVLSRFSVSGGPGAADAASELVLLEVPQPFSNHNGGMIAFGPDGFLYVGLGDGGSGGDPRGNGQNLGTLLGSILRIDVQDASAGAPYRIPPDNPFVGVAGAREEIWAYGLRNPWRFSFDPATGDLWAADVGQADREEIDLVLPGRNYGWNTMEGTNCFLTSDCDRSGLEPPVVEYGHGLGCSVTGGYVYRGAAVPALSGVYVYADFCSGRIWGFRHTDLGVSGPVHLLRAPFQVSSFGTDARGELYVLGFDGGVYRFAGDPAAPPPTPTPAPPAPTPTTVSAPAQPPASPTPTLAQAAPAPLAGPSPEPPTPTATAAPEVPLEGGRERGAIITVVIATGAGVLSLLYLVRRRRLSH
ncbi:MAG: PQQ-dependent sugar dehydrogenase [Chloroflexi bacterium]|nr:PQQ-dependent sugar dehydrogenase [Chloroflexota bacterium]